MVCEMRSPSFSYSLLGYILEDNTRDYNLSQRCLDQAYRFHWRCATKQSKDCGCAMWLWSLTMESKIWLDACCDFFCFKCIYGITLFEALVLNPWDQGRHQISPKQFQMSFPVSVDTLKTQAASSHGNTRCGENSFLLTELALLHFFLGYI